MRRDRDPRQQLLLGLVLALLGLLFLLDNFHVFDVRRILPFWPLVLIALGVLKFTQSPQGPGRGLGAALIVVGSVLTLRHLGLFDFRWRDWWPLLLIGLGVLVMVKGRIGADWGSKDAPVDELNTDRIDLTAVLGGNQSRVSSPQFSGGKVSVVLGGAQLDLRQASVEGTARLDVFVLMGGLELKVPSDWAVSVNGHPVLGAIEDKTVPPLLSSKRLVIQGEVILGGVEVRN
ncbi:LiaI-LiaF-like domain-containing protein [Paucibacter soli]|uniref:LiaI-LiaF-like domain-containing protein n=1 Tax=Paucibacter soli TaxID=3133433 RepID=UPI0030AA4176